MAKAIAFHVTRVSTLPRSPAHRQGVAAPWPRPVMRLYWRLRPAQSLRLRGLCALTLLPFGFALSGRHNPPCAYCAGSG